MRASLCDTVGIVNTVVRCLVLVKPAINAGVLGSGKASCGASREYVVLVTFDIAYRVTAYLAPVPFPAGTIANITWSGAVGGAMSDAGWWTVVSVTGGLIVGGTPGVVCLAKT